MACALTQGYNLDCRDSHGGVKEIYIIEKANATITTVAGIVTEIVNASTKRWYKYNLVAHTAEGDEALAASRENGSTTNKQSIKFPINKMTVGVRNELLLAIQNVLYVVWLDENGTPWLYGAEYGMMVATVAAKSGKVLADRNGYEIALESDEKTLAPAVTFSLLASLETAGV